MRKKAKLLKKIVFLNHSIEEQNGLAELGKPMYDKKRWDDIGGALKRTSVTENVAPRLV